MESFLSTYPTWLRELVDNLPITKGLSLNGKNMISDVRNKSQNMENRKLWSFLISGHVTHRLKWFSCLLR